MVVLLQLNGKQLFLNMEKDLKGWGGTCYKQGNIVFSE